LATTISSPAVRPAAATAFRLERGTKFVFLVPTLAYLLLLGVFPLLFSLYMLFAQWKASEITWVGLANIQRLLGQDRFWDSLRVTLTFVLLASGAELILGTVVALALLSAMRAKSLLRLLFILPMLLPPIAVAYTWKMLFDYERGPINYALTLVGLDKVAWVGERKTAIISIVLVDVWQWTPFIAIGVLAALESMPPELYEAAVVDGAGFGALLRDITFPLLAPYIVALIALRAIDAFKIVDTIVVLTGGGPGTATEVLTFYGYDAGYRTFNLGLTSAVAWSLVVVMTVVFLVFLRVFRQSEQP
jgi:multiple sugar transport system permease protein